MEFKIIWICILLIVQSVYSYGQLNKLRGTWITSDQEIIEINNPDNSTNLLVNKLQEEKSFTLVLLRDTLSFQNKEAKRWLNNRVVYGRRFDLKIISKTDTSLTLKPVSDLSRDFFGSTSILKFKKRKNIVDKSIKFEKVVYHSSACLGICPRIDLEFDTTKNIYFSLEVYEGPHENWISGEFKSRLSDSLYQEFIHLLKTSNLRTLRFPKSDMMDVVDVTLIVYFNGERKRLESSILPKDARPLLNFLFNLYKNVPLARTDEKRKIEE